MIEWSDGNDPSSKQTRLQEGTSQGDCLLLKVPLSISDIGDLLTFSSASSTSAKTKYSANSP
jgi:hypothetical protein